MRAGPATRQLPTGTRLLAVVSALIGIAAALAIPFLPVQQTEASVSWPQSGSVASVTAPLVSYAPIALEVTVPCAVVADNAAGATLVSTSPLGAPGNERYGMLARVVPAGDSARARFEIISRHTVLLSAPLDELGRDCAVTVSADPERTVVTVTGGGGAAGPVVFEQDLRPQMVGVFSALSGAAPDGLSVTAQLDTRFTTSPTLVKFAAMVVAALAAALALWSLHRIDIADGRRGRRFLPARWWSFGRIDAVVVTTLVGWHVIGANTADDGYQLGMARAAGEAGYMANYFRWFGVPEAPFGTPFYDVLAWMTQVSTASVWMRLPALVAGLLCWWVISREVAPRLGSATRRSRLPLWTGAFVFLAFWLPFNNGLRPEPIVAVGVLLTWCSVERAIATRRLLPAAAALLIGALTVTAGPSGIICFAALIAGARPVTRIVVARARSAGRAAVLLPLIATGLVVLALVFADQTAAAVLEMQRVHTATGPNVAWFLEYLRYQYLMQITVDGSLSRRFAVFTMVLTLVVCTLALLRRGGRIPGVAVGPSRRIVGITVGAMVLMMFAPTKWTHHFGIYAGLAASVAVVAAIAVGPAVLRSRRNRALFAAAVMFVVTMAFVSTNGWWYVSSWGVPWWDKAPSIGGRGFSTALFAMTVLLLLIAAWQHIRPGDGPDRRPLTRWWTIPPLTVAAAVMVAFEVLSLAKGAVSQYPGYSVARSNIDALAGSSCGLAGDVLLETDPNASMLSPVSGDVGAALAGDGSTGFTPGGVADDLTADEEDLAVGTANTVASTNEDQDTSTNVAGTAGGMGREGVNGSRVALPFGLDPGTTPVLGSYRSPGASSVTSDWYRLPEADGSGSRGDLIAIAAAGRIRSVDADGVETYGQRLDVEYGVTGSDGQVRVLGAQTPIDIGPTPAWRNLRVPLDRLPAGAELVRIVAGDQDIADEQWLAFTPPRVPQTRTLQDVVGTDTPVLLDWAVGLNFPCQRQMLHRNGIAEVPEYRILPDRIGAVSTTLWQDHYGGGPLGWTQMLLGGRTVPSYLADDWDRDWGSLEQFVPFDSDAAPAVVETDGTTRTGWWTPGPILTSY
ncbi:arabinosyltransferase domain-containing protein [Rhodococcus sp. CC-R104]|uniref:Arabinosyltransferase domain-containing protein n=1 Tax=Rhodococcus chondri TaxID=3065941 RepID=A0ABU7JYD5_9NOCA|nr:arabinosyltransferase domain-containing protein [Rhodococcus sp. CC-R104]MEE2035030.1 arabinosyltransferase domain-containing protein [Rhodococcus sp. CC-R104]